MRTPRQITSLLQPIKNKAIQNCLMSTIAVNTSQQQNDKENDSSMALKSESDNFCSFRDDTNDQTVLDKESLNSVIDSSVIKKQHVIQNRAGNRVGRVRSRGIYEICPYMK